MSQLELVTEDERAPIPEIGTLLDGKFRIDGVLGNGGMAVVLAATHLQLEQRVAIKLLLPECAENPEAVARFLVEGRSASKIRSEHVARVIDVGVDDERPYLVMEYLDGIDLNALILRDGPLPSVLAVDYVLQACEAIAEAHVGGIVHRDLKPANLFLTHRADGAACVKVLDFGISKILRPRNSGLTAHETSPLLLMGSPHYMSPEQMKSARNVDQRSDLWSLGAILHELVAGSPPFDGTTITALCAAIMTEEAPALSSPRGNLAPELAAVVRRCLEKDPADRFANVAEFAAALAPLGSDAAHNSALCIARVLEGGSDTDPSGQRPAMVSTRPAPAVEEKRADEPKLPRTHFGLLAGVIGFLLACVCACLAWIWLRSDYAVASVQPAATVAPSAAPPPMASVPSALSAAPHPSAPRPPLAAVSAKTVGPAFVAPPRMASSSPTLAATWDAGLSGASSTSDDANTDNPYDEKANAKPSNDVLSVGGNSVREVGIDGSVREN